MSRNTHTVHRDLGLLLRVARVHSELSLRAVAQYLNCGVGSVYAWEASKRTPDLQTVHRLLELYGVTGASAVPVLRAWHNEEPYAANQGL